MHQMQRRKQTQALILSSHADTADTTDPIDAVDRAVASRQTCMRQSV